MKRKKTIHRDSYKALAHNKKKRSSLARKLFLLIRMAFALSFFMLLGGIMLFVYFAKDLPDPTRLNNIDVSQSTKIYDREGDIVLYDVYGDIKRTVVPFNEISEHLKHATIAIEDEGFYSHPGVDLKAIIRAVIHNVIDKNSIQGGSTLTQQFIKNAVLTPERTITRKIKEWILAVELERRYSKDEILNFYLNQVPYGSVAYGAEAASQLYFAKSAKELTTAQSAFLAALTKAPTYYSPYGSHPEELLERKDLVIEKMFELGFISEEEKNIAKNEEVRFSKNIQNIQAPHFVMYVREYLEHTYGKESLEKGGLKVYTTLDFELQRLAEEAVAEYQETNKIKYGANNASLVAIDPKTGNILAMVGSVDYFDIENDGNVNVAIRERQPGSAFKPIVYAAALNKGYTPKTIVFDVPTEFAEPGTKSYQPQNYDEAFRGPVTMESALARSLNVPSVKTLYLAGVENTIDLAGKMGITTLRDPSRYGLSLVLGGGEMKLLDLVSAFGVFGQEGIRHPISFISRIETKDGEILEEFENTEEQVLPENTSRAINTILSDDSLRAPTFGQKSNLYIEGYDVATKTGTTQEYHDAWAIGYSPVLSAGVWVGNNNNSAMKGKAAGVYAAAPIWNYFMKRALEKFPKETFTRSQETHVSEKPILNGEFIVKKTINIDKVSGKLATSLTPSNLVTTKQISTIHSILYWVNKDAPQGDPPKNPSQDPQFDNWERGVAEWVKNSPYSSLAETDNANDITNIDDLHTKENIPEINIIKPSGYDTISDGFVEVAVKIKAALGVAQFDIFLENQLLGSYFPKKPDQSMYVYYLNIPEKQNGKVNLLVRVFDKAGNKSEDSVLVVIKNL